VSVWTNWDPLEEVIVGDCYDPGDLDWCIPGEHLAAFNRILLETKEDLKYLEILLTGLQVKVYRPTVLKYTDKIKLNKFTVQQPVSPIVPRDQYLVYGDTIYQTYTSMTDRYFDSLSFNHIFQSAFTKGYNWISQPAPNLVNIPEDKSWLNQGAIIYHKLLRKELLWHTATMFKCGDKLITNTLGPGTQAGLSWMEKNLPPATIVRNTNTTMCNWGHIDHGFFMIDDDTVICVNSAFVPKYLKTKKIYEIHQLIPEEEIEDSEMPLYKLLDPSKGYPQVVSFSSNVLVVDSNNIIFDKNLPKLFEFMNTINVKCHVAPMRHRKFWAAGIHCVTLDIRRCGQKRKIINAI
jgi:hypothetical protein